MTAPQSGPGTDAAALHRTVAAQCLERIHGIVGNAWLAASPCEGWTARDVVAHLVVVHRRVLVRLRGGDLPGIEPPPARPGEDLPAELGSLVAQVQDAMEDPAQASQRVDSIIGPMTFADLVETLLASDVLLHTWDLARATGQDERLDAVAVRQAMGFLSPRDAQLRVPGEFGPALEAPTGADEQTRLLAFSGRHA